MPNTAFVSRAPFWRTVLIEWNSERDFFIGIELHYMIEHDVVWQVFETIGAIILLHKEAN